MSYVVNALFFNKSTSDYQLIVTDAETIAHQFVHDTEHVIEVMINRMSTVSIDHNGFLFENCKSLYSKKYDFSKSMYDNFDPYFDYFSSNFNKKYEYVIPFIKDFCKAKRKSSEVIPDFESFCIAKVQRI